MTLFLKIIPALLFWGVFAIVVLYIPYPETLTAANFTQIALFFITLFLGLLFTFNFVLKNIFISSSISLGLFFLLLLKALDSLNLVTAVLTILAIGLLISYFRKVKRRSLTKLPKIPKLTSLRRNK